MGFALRILSCNLQRGAASAGPLTQLLETLSVDVVCAQESNRTLGSAMAELLPEGNLHEAWRYRGVGFGARRAVKLSRFAMPRRDGWAVELSPTVWTGLSESLTIVNVHILGPHLWPYFPNPLRRRQQLKALAGFLDDLDGRPFAVLGDFNASPLWPFYRFMKKRYQDAALSADRDRPAPPTWPHWPRLGIRGLIRIDHCFLSRLRARSSKLVELPGSDHFGLLVDLEP